MGILPSGAFKQPSKTGTGLHGSFVPIVISEVLAGLAKMLSATLP